MNNKRNKKSAPKENIEAIQSNCFPGNIFQNIIIKLKPYEFLERKKNIP